MAMLPIRGLAEKGIMLDPSPYDLSPNAFSNGNNFWFEPSSARRAPIYRTWKTLPGYDPQAAFAYRPATGFDQVFTGGQDGMIRQVTPSTSADVSPAGRTGLSTPTSWTAVNLGGVLYLNKSSHVPCAWLPGATQMVPLTGWDSTWRCEVIRAYKDFVVGINISKGSARYPAMVKWSNATLFGQMPDSWNETDITKLASENTLAQLDSPLVDAAVLRDSLILYSESQVWSMTYTGDNSDSGQNLFVFRPMFSDGGAMSANCAVEVDGKHYVFGTSDLFVHDGTEKSSLANGRARNWVFANLNTLFADRCFVAHLPTYKVVLFCFPSNDANAKWRDPTRCNRALVFNYDTGTMAPMDLPNVGSVCLANANPAMVWTDTLPTNTAWTSLGGSWADLGDGFATSPLITVSPLTGAASTPRIAALDYADFGYLPQPADTEINSDAFLERVGIDLDEVNLGLNVYKIAQAVFPQVSAPVGGTVLITLGSSLYPSGPVTWGPERAFAPTTNYKLNNRLGGRYLAIRFRVTSLNDVFLTGFDVDVIAGGQR